MTNLDRYEQAVDTAQHLTHCANRFARCAHALREAGQHVAAELEEHRARVYRRKAAKELANARQHLTH